MCGAYNGERKGRGRGGEEEGGRDRARQALTSVQIQTPAVGRDGEIDTLGEVSGGNWGFKIVSVGEFLQRIIKQ